MPEPRPPRRENTERTPVRLFAVAGVAGLLVVLVLVISMIGSAASGDDSEPTAEAPVASATAEATKTPKPDPTPEPLTPEEEAALQQAIDLVASRDFEVVDEDDWDPEATLQVLIGKTTEGSRLAFWFVDGTYLGNDSTEVSSKLKVAASDDTEVTLRYGIYQDGDEAGKPTGEPIDVVFRYEAGTVEPVEALPEPEVRLP